MPRYLAATIPLLALLALLAACGLLGNEGGDVEATNTPELPTPADTPAVNAEDPTPAPEETVNPESLTFTLWTVPEVSPRTEIPGGAVLLDQLNAFDSSHPDLSLYVELKTDSGQGGMLSYLRTGRGVAPGILPDVIILPADQLAGAVADGLVVSLEGLQLAPEMFEDLFPAGQELVTLGETTYAYPLALTEFGHIAYDGNAVTETIPADWDSFIDLENGRLVFPAAGSDGAKLALQFYLAEGGTLTDVSGAPQLEVEPLTTALEVIADAVNNGFVLPASGEITTLAETWQLFQTGSATIAQTEAEQFLGQRALGFNASFAPIPGPTDYFAPLAGAWVIAMTTPDPARQAIVAELISWLSSPANMGAWSLESGHVPARRSAFDVWPADDPYADFLRLQSELAEPFPEAANVAIMSALTEAVTAVVRRTSTPTAAAQAAAASLQP